MRLRGCVAPTPRSRWPGRQRESAPAGTSCCVLGSPVHGRLKYRRRAMNILRELHAAVEELVGRAAVLTDGKAGTIDYVFLDDVHGLRISIAGHEGHWPISTVKL